MRKPKCQKCKSSMTGHCVWELCLMWWCDNKKCSRYRLYAVLSDKENKEVYEK